MGDRPCRGKFSEPGPALQYVARLKPSNVLQNRPVCSSENTLDKVQFLVEFRLVALEVA